LLCSVGSSFFVCRWVSSLLCGFVVHLVDGSLEHVAEPGTVLAWRCSLPCGGRKGLGVLCGHCSRLLLLTGLRTLCGRFVLLRELLVGALRGSLARHRCGSHMLGAEDWCGGESGSAHGGDRGDGGLREAQVVLAEVLCGLWCHLLVVPRKDVVALAGLPVAALGAVGAVVLGCRPERRLASFAGKMSLLQARSRPRRGSIGGVGGFGRYVEAEEVLADGAAPTMPIVDGVERRTALLANDGDRGEVVPVDVQASSAACGGGGVVARHCAGEIVCVCVFVCCDKKAQSRRLLLPRSCSPSP